VTIEFTILQSLITEAFWIMPLPHESANCVQERSIYGMFSGSQKAKGMSQQYDGKFKLGDVFVGELCSA
jgi:hypothetical protein